MKFLGFFACAIAALALITTDTSAMTGPGREIITLLGLGCGIGAIGILFNEIG